MATNFSDELATASYTSDIKKETASSSEDC
jgi:hypothetical protein